MVDAGIPNDSSSKKPKPKRARSTTFVTDRNFINLHRVSVNLRKSPQCFTWSNKAWICAFSRCGACATDHRRAKAYNPSFSRYARICGRILALSCRLNSVTRENGLNSSFSISYPAQIVKAESLPAMTQRDGLYRHLQAVHGAMPRFSVPKPGDGD
jgi:hypothetical protein